MPISSGAGGKPNSYFNPTNALTRRASVTSVNYNSQGSPGYYYGGYGGDQPSAATMATVGGIGGTTVLMGGAGASPRGVQVVDISGPGSRVQQNGQSMVTRESPSRRCCPCPNRSRPEMRMPTMPKSKLATAGSAVSRHGCCVFLIGLLALALVGGLIAGLYFLITQVTGIRMAREAFYLIPGRRTGDLMWVIYGTMQECEPVTTAASTTASTTTTTPTTTTRTSVTSATSVTSTVPTTTTTVATSTQTPGTTLISCASTTFRYVQVTLAGGRPGPALPWPAMATALGLLHHLLIGWRGWHA